MSKLLLTIRHDIFSGSFFDAGVKKFATALPDTVSVYCFAVVDLLNSLVVVDCCFCFLVSGGETPLLVELGRFPRPGRFAILKLSPGMRGALVCSTGLC